MAGTLKVRDTDGTLRTVTSLKVRDVDGTLRTLAFIRVRDVDGTLREVFTAAGGGGGGGGGGGTANPASINPGYQASSGRGTYKAASFMAVSSGSAPTAYSWGFLDGDQGAVVSGGTTANATLRVEAQAGDSATATFFCDMTIDGTVHRATCQLAYTNTTPSSLQ